MYDKILQTKKEMRNVIKSRGMTRQEKYNLVKLKSNALSNSEREILIKECRRDYETYDRVKDIKELITVFLTGIGMMLTVFGIFFREPVADVSSFLSLTIMVSVFAIFSVFILSFLQSWRNSNLAITKYMIDVLEENE